MFQTIAYMLKGLVGHKLIYTESIQIKHFKHHSLSNTLFFYFCLIQYCEIEVDEAIIRFSNKVFINIC